MMLIKNGEYNSLWRLVGELKSKESKTISLPVRPRPSFEYSTHPLDTPIESLNEKITKDIFPLTPTDQNHSSKIKTEEQIETKLPIINTQNSLSGDYHQDNLSMMMIEDHQKRHTFAPTLYQAQQNYRELRRLLKKINGPLSKEQKKQN